MPMADFFYAIMDNSEIEGHIADCMRIKGQTLNFSNSEKTSLLSYFPAKHQNSTDSFHESNIFAGISKLEFVTEGVLVTAIGFLGIIANLISLVILSRPQMRSSVNCGLQGLAVFDTLVLICAVLMLGLNKLGRRWDFLKMYAFEISPFIIPIAYPVGLIAQTGSVWTTVAVTVERYVAVCHPLRARSLCTYRRARVFNLLITVFAITYNMPRFWEVELSETLLPDLNVTFYQIVASQFRINKLYYEVYYIWLYLLVMYFIPFFTLAALNVFIWHTIQKSNRDRQRLSRRQEKEISLAMMLFCVVIIFFICNILALLVNVIEYFDVFLPPLVRISNLLITLNSSVNFVIYYIFGRKFKMIFLNIFCNYQRTNFNDSLRGSTFIRFRKIKSSSGSLNNSINGNTYF